MQHINSIAIKNKRCVQPNSAQLTLNTQTLAGDDGLPLMELLCLGSDTGGRVAEEKLAGVADEPLDGQVRRDARQQAVNDGHVGLA